MIKRIYLTQEPEVKKGTDSSLTISRPNTSLFSYPTRHAPAGIGLKLILQPSSLCDDPRPVGYNMYILDKNDKMSEDLSEEFADQTRMEYSYGNFQLLSYKSLKYLMLLP